MEKNQVNGNKIWWTIKPLVQAKKYEEVCTKDVLKKVLEETEIDIRALQGILISLINSDKVDFEVKREEYQAVIAGKKSYKEMAEAVKPDFAYERIDKKLVYRYLFYKCGVIVGEAGCEEAMNALLTEKMGGSLKSYLSSKRDATQGKKQADTEREESKETDRIFGRNEPAALGKLLFLHDIFAKAEAVEKDGKSRKKLTRDEFDRKVETNKELWDNKKDLLGEILEEFPDVVDCLADGQEVFFSPEEYETLRETLLSRSVKYVLCLLWNKSKYFHMLNQTYLNLAREKGDKEVWLLLFKAIHERDRKDLNENVLMEEKIELPQPERLAKFNFSSKKDSFASLGDCLNPDLYRFYMYQCGLIAGTEEDRKNCLQKVNELIKEKEGTKEAEYMEFTLDFHFLRMCTWEDAEKEINGKKAEFDDALKALLCAFANKSESFATLAEKNNWDKLWKSACFADESYVAERRYGNLAETFECVLATETADVIDHHGRFMERLVFLFDDSKLQRIRYEELLRNTVKEQEKELFLENCIADFENVEAWDLLTKFYHETENISMRDAGNMYELIRYPYLDKVKRSVLTNVQRSLERTVMGALPENFLDNSLYFLKWAASLSKDNRAGVKNVLDKYWGEFVKQMNRHRYMANLEDGNKKKKVIRFLKYACMKLERNKEFPCEYIGSIVFTVLKQNRELWEEFWLSEFCYEYQEDWDCPFERYLLQKGKNNKYIHSKELFHVLKQTYFTIKNSTNEDNKKAINQYFMAFFAQCDIEAFPKEVRLDYGRVARILAEIVKESEVKRDVKEELLIEMLKEYPEFFDAGATVYDVYGYTYSREYFAALEYVQEFYKSSFSVQEDIFMNLKRCMGNLMESDTMVEDEKDALRDRTRRLMFRSGQCCLNTWKMNDKDIKLEVIRYARDMYALMELYSNPAEKEPAKEKLLTIVEKTGNTESLRNYEAALIVLLHPEQSKMTDPLRQDIIDCGLTNHWDPFVENVFNGKYDACTPDEEVFNLYLAQIDYRKFRRSVLQKIVQDRMNQEEKDGGYKEKLERIVGTNPDSATGPLSEAIKYLEDIPNAKPFFDMILTRKYRDWQNLKSEISSFYENSEADDFGITVLLTVLITNSYYPEDIVKLIHSMSCNRDKAVYAQNLIKTNKAILMPYRANYYSTISYAMDGNADKAIAAYRECVKAEEQGVSGEELYADKNMISRCNEKLRKHIIDTSDGYQLYDKLGDNLDERIMWMELEPANLFKFEFLHEVRPLANESFDRNKDLFFKYTTSVAEKCECAKRIFYWLEYGGYQLGEYDYGAFLLEWALNEAENAAEDKRIEKLDDVYNAFNAVADVHSSVFKKSKQFYYEKIAEAFCRCLADAKIRVPRKTKNETFLYANRIKVGGKSLIDLRYHVLKGLRHDFTDVIDGLLNVFNAKDEQNKNLILDSEGENVLSNALNDFVEAEEISEKIRRFALNFQKELGRRMNGDLELTALNQEDDTDALYVRIKNVSGEKKQLLYMNVVEAESQEERYLITDLEEEGICYGEVKLNGASYETCRVEFYEDSEYGTRKLCEFDGATWKKESDGSQGKEETVSPVVERVIAEIKRYETNKWLKMERTFTVEDLIDAMEGRAVEITWNKGELESTLVSELKTASKDLISGDGLADIATTDKEKFYVFCHVEDMDDAEDLYISDRTNRTVYFVFYGKTWKTPKDSLWSTYLQYIEPNYTFSEAMVNSRKVTMQEGTFFFTDETLQCMEQLLKKDEKTQTADMVTAARDELEGICKRVAEDDSRRRAAEGGTYLWNVYPSDLKAVWGGRLALIEKVESTNLEVKAANLALKKLDDEEFKKQVHTSLEERGKFTPYDKGSFLGVGVNIGKLTNQNIGAGGIGVVGDYNHQEINNFINVFNLYTSPDFQKLKDAEENLKNAEDALAKAKDELFEANADLKQKREEIKELWEALEELDQDSEEAKKEKEELIKKIEENEKVFTRLLEKSEKDDEQMKLLKETVANQTAVVEGLKSAVEDAEDTVARIEAEKNDEINKMAEEYKKGFNLDTVVMAKKLFPNDWQAVRDVMPYMANNAYHKNAFDNAIFVHYLFACILEDMCDRATNNGTVAGGSATGGSAGLDYSPVNLMYAKLYEALLKCYHLPVYIKRIGDKDAAGHSTGKGYYDVKGHFYFDSLSNRKKEKLTIGDFYFPLDDQQYFDMLKDVGRTPGNRRNRDSSRYNYPTDDDWSDHKARINDIKGYRNGCAHSGNGRSTTGAITKTGVDALTELLFRDKGYELVFKTGEVRSSAIPTNPNATT